MTRHLKGSKGFSVIELFIVLVVLLAAGLGGWYVWHKGQKKDTKQASQSTGTSQSPDKNKQAHSQNTQRQADETANWVSITTQGGGFSMRVPDGWSLTKYPDDFVGAVAVTYVPGTGAVVDTSNAAYAGHSLRFRASITPLDDAGLGPQWASPQPGLEESTEDFSIGTVQGKRYKGVFTQGPNQTLYEYVFGLGSQKKLDIVYTVDHSHADKDDVATVEKAIKTIQLK